MRVAIISHSYLAKENRKQLKVLSKRVQLEVISPSTMSGFTLPYNYNQSIHIGESSFVKFYRKLSFPFPSFLSSQYFLFSTDFNFRKFQPQIIHIEYDPWNLIFLQTFFLRNIFKKRVPMICTVKQNTYTKYSFFITKIKDLVGNYFIKKVDHFIAVSEKTASLYKERFNVNSEKFTCMTQLGVDTNLFKPVAQKQKIALRKNHKLPKDAFIIGYAGRFDEVKGIKTLLRAVKKARISKDINLHLALIGAGNLKGFLLRESEKDTWLHVLPKVPHAKVADFLKTLDIFVMPSQITKYHEEHDAHALLEAMSIGLPCIGTNSGAIPEILEDIGIVIKAEDKSELSSKILKLFYNKELRKRLGILGRKTITSRYSIESIALQRYQVYKQVCQKTYKKLVK